MKTIRILIVLYFCFLLQNSFAQDSHKENYPKISGITALQIRTPDCTKLADISYSHKLVSNDAKPHPKKKIKPYESNKTSIFGQKWYKVAGSTFNGYKNQHYRFQETPGQNNPQYPVKPSTKR